MKLLGESKRNLLVGAVAGFGVAVVGRELWDGVASVGRPLAKSAMRTGFALFEKGREGLAYVEEVVEDLFAEVRDEMNVQAANEAAQATAAALLGSDENREEAPRKKRSGDEASESERQRRGA